jgi:putative membrane protein
MSENVNPETGVIAPPPAAPGLPSYPEAVPSGSAPGRPLESGPYDPATTVSSGATGPGPEGPDSKPSLKVTRTRTSTTYLAVGVSLVLLVLVIIFVAQNEKQANVHFLSFHFKLALGLIILASVVAGGLVVLLISLARVLQLRLMARRHRKAHDHT